jgi:hypothetical protein
MYIGMISYSLNITMIQWLKTGQSNALYLISVNTKRIFVLLASSPVAAMYHLRSGLSPQVSSSETMCEMPDVVSLALRPHYYYNHYRLYSEGDGGGETFYDLHNGKTSSGLSSLHVSFPCVSF